MKTEVEHYKDKKPKPNKSLIVKSESDKKKVGPAKIGYYLFFGFVVIATLFLVSWVSFQRRPLTENADDFKYFEIKKGESTKEIGKKLKDEKVIRSDLAFLFEAKFSSKKIQTGHYKIASSMGLGEILEKFEKGEVDAFSVTIPEGFRVLQIARTLKEKGVDPDKFISSAIGTEGTLFPDTYVFPVNLEVSKIVRLMKENYEKRTQNLNVTNEQLIIASLVEREAIKDDERAKIAAVYNNRADNNMLFQADPTIRYALDTQLYMSNKSLDFDFWKPLTRAEINSLNSPFNTYKQKGYPPAPICNPGLKSIQAAVNPEKDFDSLYFFHDENQAIHFSKTYQEHQDQIKKFGL